MSEDHVESDEKSTDWDGLTHTKTPTPEATHGVKATSAAPQAPAKTPGPISYEGGAWDRTEANLPKDLKSLIALQVSLFGYGTRDAYLDLLGEAEFTRCREIVGTACHAAQQGLPTVTFAKAVTDRERHYGRAEHRSRAIAKLQGAMQDGSLGDERPVKFLVSDPLLVAAIGTNTGSTDLIGLNKCPMLFAVARARLAAYALEFYKNWERVNYLERLEELRVELANATALTPDRVEEIHKAMAQLQASANQPEDQRGSSAAALVSESACIYLRQQYAPVHDITVTITEELIRLLEFNRSNSVKWEAEFFACHGLPHSPTHVSLRWGQIITGMRGQLAQLVTPQGHVTIQPVHPQQCIIANMIEVPGLT